jgi:hypothetical protein
VWIGHIGVTFAKSAFIDDYFMDIWNKSVLNDCFRQRLIVLKTLETWLMALSRWDKSCSALPEYTWKWRRRTTRYYAKTLAADMYLIICVAVWENPSEVTRLGFELWVKKCLKKMKTVMVAWWSSGEVLVGHWRVTSLWSNISWYFSYFSYFRCNFTSSLTCNILKMFEWSLMICYVLPQAAAHSTFIQLSTFIGLQKYLLRTKKKMYVSVLQK